MPYLKKKPLPPLDRFIESIDVQEVWDSNVQVTPTRILPNGSVDLLFYYGDRFLHEDAAGETLSPNAFVFGQRTSVYNVRATGTTGIVIVRFFPWGMSAFCDIDVNEFNDACIHLDDVFPDNGGTRCLELIHQAVEPEKKILAVEKFLLQRLVTRDYQNPSKQIVFSVCGAINQCFGNVSIKALAKKHGISKRQLDRKFLQAVGITPKRFARISRFQKSMYFGASCLASAEVATMVGYFDQAHMNKDFRQLAKCTPNAIFRGERVTPLMVRYNPHNVSHFYNTRYLQ